LLFMYAKDDSVSTENIITGKKEANILVLIFLIFICIPPISFKINLYLYIDILQ